MSKKSIPPKNYLILFGIVLLVICACFAAYNLYNIYQENKVRTSPLANKEVLYEDLKNATIEIDADTFLVISYIQNREIHNNENEIKKYLNKNNLLDNDAGIYVQFPTCLATDLSAPHQCTRQFSKACVRSLHGGSEFVFQRS